MDKKKGKRIFDKITTVVGCVLFGSWCIAGAYYYCKATVEFIFSFANG